MTAWGVIIELRAVGPLQTGYVAGKFDNRDLHAQTDAKVGNLFRRGMARSPYLAFNTPRAEAPGHENTVIVKCNFWTSAVWIERLRIDIGQLHTCMW
jgi:hypothetical protein